MIRLLAPVFGFYPASRIKYPGTINVRKPEKKISRPN
jgi:hypothetical protein